MPHHVDARLNTVQSARAQPRRDSASPKTHLIQLPPLDNPVLPAGERGNPAIVIARPQKGTLKVLFYGLSGRGRHRVRG